MPTFIGRALHLGWIDPYASGVVLVIVSVAAAMVGPVAVRRTLHRGELGVIHDVGGAMFPVAGTSYAVSLGLIVVDSP